MKRILMGGVFGDLALTLSSCYSTRILYGNVERNEPLVQVNREWNHHLIAGLIPVGNGKVEAAEYVGGAPDYVVKTNMSFLNLLVSGITFGIYTPTQTKFYVPLRSVDSTEGKERIKTDE